MAWQGGASTVRHSLVPAAMHTEPTHTEPIHPSQQVVLVATLLLWVMAASEAQVWRSRISPWGRVRHPVGQQCPALVV